MQKTLLLHIGTAKTGSTSIQRWLAAAQERGDLSRISYPLWGRDHNHQRLVAIYKSHDELPPAMRQSYGPGGRHYDRMRDQYRKFLFKELRTASNAVISGESLCGLLSPLLTARMREDLEQVGFREFRIVLYVRDPADFYLSGAQQMLKMGHARPFLQDPATFKYDFLNWSQTWEKVFPGKLIVRKFPPLKHGDVVKDFSVILEESLGIAVPWAPYKWNTSLSAEGMQILQDYRETFSPDNPMLMPDALRLRSFLKSSEQELPQTKPVLRREVSELIRANHKGDARLLYSRYGVDLSLDNSNPKVLPPSKSGQSYRVDEIVEMVDSDIVYRLLLRVARNEFGRRRPLTLRVAAIVYRSIPLVLRPKRLEAWLRRWFLDTPT